MDARTAQLIIIHLQETDGLILPFGSFPGSFPGGDYPQIFESESNWNSYQWNPPQYLPDDYPTADPDASPKPTWTRLIQVASVAELADIKLFLTRNLRRACRERITLAYGQDNRHDEVELRLGGRHTEAQDTERERLRTRYSIIKAWIESTDRTLTELESLDLTDDTNWTGETWPPTRGGL